MVGDDGAEGHCQPSLSIHAVQLADLDKRGDDGPVFDTGVVTGKECVLLVQCNRTENPLDGIVVELDAAIIQEQLEPGPVFGDLAQGFPQRRFR